MHQDLEHFKN